MNLINILNKAINFILAVILFFSPLVFAFIFRGDNVFEFYKLTFFKITVVLFVFFTLVKIFLAGFERDFFVRWRKLFFLGGLLFLSFLGAFIWSDYPEIAFYGGYWKLQGFSTWIYVFVFAIFFAYVLETKKQINKFLQVAFFSGLAVSFLGLAEILGFVGRTWSYNFLSVGRVSSSIGQPNFLASWLLLIVPISFYLFFKEKKKILKYVYLIGFAIQISILILTFSRAGWLGLVLEVVFLIGFLVLQDDFFKKKINLYLSLVLVLFGFVFLLSNDDFNRRLKGFFNPQAGSAKVRMDTWSKSWEAIKQKPLTGYGLEAQKIIFYKNYQSEDAVYSDVNSHPGRAHNIFLDTWLSRGLIGVLASVMFFGVAFFVGIKNFFKRKRFFDFFLLVGLSGYYFSLLFSFSFITSIIYSSVFLIFLFFKPKKQTGEPIFILQSKTGKISACLLVFFGAFFLIDYNFKVARADFYLNKIQKSFFKENEAEALVYSSLLSEMQNKQVDFLQKPKALIFLSEFDLANSFLAKEVLTQTKNYYEDILKFKDSNYTHKRAMAKAEEFFFTYNDCEECILKSVKIYKDLIAESPETPANYFDLAEALALSGDFSGAEYNYKKALEKLPPINHPDMNDGHKRAVNYYKYSVYKKLGRIYYFMDDYEAEEDALKKSFELNWFDGADIFRSLAGVYFLQGDIEKAIFWTRQGQTAFPDAFDWEEDLRRLKSSSNF